MHSELLSPEQIMLLPLIREFSKPYFLVGGTAIALQIGHRRSIDFDLFTQGKVSKLDGSLKRRISSLNALSMKIPNK